MLKRVPKWIWTISGVFLVMQYLICLNVYMMGDDYMYGTYGHEGIVQQVFSYYLTGNGRWLMNILDSMCLSFDRYLYIIVMPWLLLMLGMLLYVFISEVSGGKSGLTFAAALVAISCVNILMAREVFYWITGAVNYFVPALLLLAAMTAVMKMRSEIISKRRTVIYSLICISSCLTMEQYVLMTIGWMFLIWGRDYVLNRKSNRTNTAVFLTCVFAAATILLAPSNSIRLEDAVRTGNALHVKMMDLLYYDYFSSTSAAMVFIITAYLSYMLFREKRTGQAIAAGIHALFLLFVYDYSFVNLNGRTVVLTVMASIVISLIMVIPSIAAFYRPNGTFCVLSLFIIAAGSQIMLLKTDIWGFRTSFSWMILYVMIMLLLIAYKADNQNYAVFVCLACISINPFMGMFGMMVLTVILVRKKPISAIALILSIFVIGAGLLDEAIGYRNNGFIHRKNIHNIEAGKSAGSIQILKYPNEQYGWNPPPLSEFHERYFRSYYNIPNDVVIIYEE